MSIQHAGSYAGDVTSTEAYQALTLEPSALLVDVRTKAEWTFVGAPDLAKVGKKPIFLEWQQYPSMIVNSEFVGRLGQLLQQSGATAETPIYFLCRSGARSRSAATAMAAAGQTHCFNIADGFEGPLDAGRRGQRDGWKAKSLPWTQS